MQRLNWTGPDVSFRFLNIQLTTMKTLWFFLRLTKVLFKWKGRINKPLISNMETKGGKKVENARINNCPNEILIEIDENAYKVWLCVDCTTTTLLNLVQEKTKKIIYWGWNHWRYCTLRILIDTLDRLLSHDHIAVVGFGVFW